MTDERDTPGYDSLFGFPAKLVDHPQTGSPIAFSELPQNIYLIFTFPADRFIEYEPSDLAWAIPLGLAKVHRLDASQYAVQELSITYPDFGPIQEIKVRVRLK